MNKEEIKSKIELMDALEYLLLSGKITSSELYYKDWTLEEANKLRYAKNI